MLFLGIRITALARRQEFNPFTLRDFQLAHGKFPAHSPLELGVIISKRKYILQRIDWEPWLWLKVPSFLLGLALYVNNS